MSTKPGVTRRPRASIVRRAAPMPRPTSAMRPSRTATSPSKASRPVPPTILPPRIRRSCTVAPFVRSGAVTLPRGPAGASCAPRGDPPSRRMLARGADPRDRLRPAARRAAGGPRGLPRHPLRGAAGERAALRAAATSAALAGRARRHALRTGAAPGRGGLGEAPLAPRRSRDGRGMPDAERLDARAARGASHSRLDPRRRLHQWHRPPPPLQGARPGPRGRAVVVTLNYRVGALGFLHLEGAGGIEAANLGLQDQLAALAWVRAHATRLGGDPGRIAVFGESAGAGSIAALLAMPGARGAFRRAIAQSPACEGMIRPGEAERRSAKLLAKLGLSPASAARLREVPAPRLLAAQGECLAEGPWATGMLFPPVVDGKVLPELPLDAVRRGAARDVALAIGTTADEMMLYGADEPAGIPDAARAPILAAQLAGAPARREADARRLLEAYRAARAARGAGTGAREL